MARRTKITIETGPSLVVVQDYETATGQIYQMKAGGFGEYTMAQYANVDLTNAAAMIALIHSDGTTFQAVAIESIESVTINGVAATITNLSLVRDAVSPYFFSLGGGGYSFYKELTLTSAILLNQIAAPGYEILPAVAGHYYEWSIDWEYTYGGVAYSTAMSAPTFYSYNGVSTFQSLAVISNTALTVVANRVCAGIHPQMISTAHNTFGVGEAIVLKLANNQNATLGNGSVLLRIRYNLIKFTVA